MPRGGSSPPSPAAPSPAFFSFRPPVGSPPSPRAASSFPLNSAALAFTASAKSPSSTFFQNIILAKNALIFPRFPSDSPSGSGSGGGSHRARTSR